MELRPTGGSTAPPVLGGLVRRVPSAMSVVFVAVTYNDTQLITIGWARLLIRKPTVGLCQEVLTWRSHLRKCTKFSLVTSAAMHGLPDLNRSPFLKVYLWFLIRRLSCPLL